MFEMEQHLLLTGNGLSESFHVKKYINQQEILTRLLIG